MADVKPGDVLLECIPFGNSLRVTAIDSVTGTEVTFQAPARASSSELKYTAINKLNYVLRKQKQK